MATNTDPQVLSLPIESQAPTPKRMHCKKWAVIIVTTLRAIIWAILLLLLLNTSFNFNNSKHIMLTLFVVFLVSSEMVGLVGAIRANVCALAYYLVFIVLVGFVDLLWSSESSGLTGSTVMRFLVYTCLCAYLVGTFLKDCQAVQEQSKRQANMQKMSRELEECKG